MKRDIRFQGAVMRDHHLLLIRHRVHATGESYWLLPGGGREDGETDEVCVAREMLEETNLTVAVERLLLEEPADDSPYYDLRRTYLCRVVAGEASPGYEPEVEASADYGIVEVAWLDLRDPAGWPPQALNDPITSPQLQRLRAALGYAAGAPA